MVIAVTGVGKKPSFNVTVAKIGTASPQASQSDVPFPPWTEK